MTCCGSSSSITRSYSVPAGETLLFQGAVSTKEKLYNPIALGGGSTNGRAGHVCGLRGEPRSGFQDRCRLAQKSIWNWLGE